MFSAASAAFGGMPSNVEQLDLAAIICVMVRLSALCRLCKSAIKAHTSLLRDCKKILPAAYELFLLTTI